MNFKIIPGVIDFLFILISWSLLYTCLYFSLPYIEVFISKGFYNEELVSIALLTGFWWIIIPYLISFCFYKYTINVAYLSILIYAFSVFNYEDWNPSYYFFIFMVIIAFLIFGWALYQWFAKKSRKYFLWFPLILILAIAVWQVDLFISWQEISSDEASLQNIISFLLWWIFGLVFNFIALDSKKEGLEALYKKWEIIE